MLASEATSTERVYDAIVELYNLGQRSTRHTVQELTGLPLTKVDDRIKALAERERIKRFLKGEYVPVEVHPPARAISKTILAGGLVKVEIGDEVLTLTPTEDRMLATLMAGAATQAGQIETNRAVSEMASTMLAKVEALEKRLLTAPSGIKAACGQGYREGYG
ncbi:hypothetical protein ACFIQF_12915 [Comamonas sp. J-3]|uniref:hypothetical protein n=1 Tax=Comamonas trifloxystrobinivorans TaxID=3350256 RepID=UPI00372C014D